MSIRAPAGIVWLIMRIILIQFRILSKFRIERKRFVA